MELDDGQVRCILAASATKECHVKRELLFW